MSIIRGFIGGAAKGTADASRMLLQNQLDKERREADFLRQEQLQKGRQEFTTSERKAGEVVTRELQTEKIEAQKEIAAGKTPKPQLIKYTDNKGNEQEGILQKNEDGSFNIVKPGTGDVVEQEITREDLKNKAAQMNVAEGRGDDWIPWNEFGVKDPEVRAAIVKERGEGKGIVGSKITTPPPKQEGKAPQRALDYVKSNPEALPDFIKKYGYDPTKQ